MGSGRGRRPTEQERIVAWARSVVDGEPSKRPTDLRIARGIVGLAAVLDKGEPERCPTCNSNDREKRGVEMLRNMTQDFVDCRNPWHGGTDDQ